MSLTNFSVVVLFSFLYITVVNTQPPNNQAGQTNTQGAQTNTQNAGGALPVDNWTRDAEKQVRKSLFVDKVYVKEARPASETLVSIGFYLTSLDEVNIKEESFSVSGWWALSWEDPDLKWTSNDVGVMMIYPYDLWTPPLIVSNSIDDLSAIFEKTIPMRVNSLGQVYWRPPALLSMSCDMDTTYFPFDKQTCSIQVTTAGYTKKEIRLGFRDSIILYDFYEESGEWIIAGDDTSVEMITDDNLPYPKLTVEFNLKRRSFSYWLSMIIPVVVSSFLVSFVFYLPTDCGEKMGYALTNLLAFVVVLTIVTDSLSDSSRTTSLLEIYVIGVLFKAAMSVVIAAIVMNYHSEPEGQQISALASPVAVVMGYCCCRCVTCPDSKEAMYMEDGPTDSTDTGCSGSVRMTSQEFAVLIDTFFFRLYILSFTVMTVVLMYLLNVGATYNSLD